MRFVFIFLKKRASMIPFMYHWPIAFTITQCIEIPIYLWGLNTVFLQKPLFDRLILVFFASALTHPLIFLYLPIPCQAYQLSQSHYIILAESIAIFLEYLYFRFLGFQVFSLVLFANIMSATIGTICFRFLILKDHYAF